VKPCPLPLQETTAAVPAISDSGRSVLRMPLRFLPSRTRALSAYAGGESPGSAKRARRSGGAPVTASASRHPLTFGERPVSLATGESPSAAPRHRRCGRGY